MDITIRAITHTNCSDLEPSSAATSLFWPLPPGLDGAETASEDPKFDKQLWLQRVLLEWGICGYTAFVGTGQGGAKEVPAATIFFAPPAFLPGAQRLPSGPISPDAILISAVHVALPYMGLYLEHQLIDTVLTEAHRRGIKAVEAFGRVEHLDEDVIEQATQAGQLPVEHSALDELQFVPEAYRGWDVVARQQRAAHGGEISEQLAVAPMLSEDILEAEGFTIVKHDRYFPRYRREISGTGSLFASYAEDDHALVNGDTALQTVIGGRSVGAQALLTLPRLRVAAG